MLSLLNASYPRVASLAFGIFAAARFALAAVLLCFPAAGSTAWCDETPSSEKETTSATEPAEPEEDPVAVARSTSSDEPPTASPVVNGGDAGGNNGVAAKPPLPANPEKPYVALSDGHEKTCRKLVGDKIEAVEVIDFNGQSHSFSDLLSDQLTVLVFWNETSVLAREQFRRIPVEVLGTFAHHRVKAIAVNVKGSAETTRILTGNAADKIVSLVDTDATFFHQLADSRVPRTYILDKDGHILWFDVEYSQSMVRSMENALAYFLTTRDEL